MFHSVSMPCCVPRTPTSHPALKPLPEKQKNESFFRKSFLRTRTNKSSPSREKKKQITQSIRAEQQANRFSRHPQLRPREGRFVPTPSRTEDRGCFYPSKTLYECVFVFVSKYQKKKKKMFGSHQAEKVDS